MITPTQRVLLRAVADGFVCRHYRLINYDFEDRKDHPSGHPTRVNAAIDTLRAAGLVTLGDADAPGSVRRRPWVLTGPGWDELES